MDVFDLVAKIRLDSSEYESGLGKAKGSMATLASGVGKGLATVAKVGAAAVSAGVAGVAALTKIGIDGYSQYEQLAGGMKKIFDGMDTSRIATDAANAYKDMGMSANEYLAIINDVGASFAATMGNEAGYDAAKKGLTAISDYASGTGKNFGYLQEKLAMITRSTSSYQSIADQFSGILPATSEGFLKQAQAAGILEGKYKKLTDVPINEYQKAVTEMLAVGVDALNLTGNTADEAATTLSGSLTMMKKAWENLVVGMADPNADIGLLITNMVDSATAAAKQLIPAIEKTLGGIGELITNLSPVIGEAIPVLVETVLPSLLTAGINLVKALVEGIAAAAPDIYEAFKDAIFMTLTDVFGLSEESAHKFVDTTDGIIQDLVALFQAIPVALKWISEQAETEGTFFNMVWENIKAVVSAAISIIQGAIKAFTAILTGDWSTAWNYILSIAETIMTSVTNIILSIVDWIDSFLGTMVEKGIELINSLSEGMQNKFAEILTLVTGWITDNIVTPIVNTVSSFVSAGKQLINSLKDGALQIFAVIFGQAGGWIQTNIVTPIVNKVSDFVSAGKDLINSLRDGALAIFAEILGQAGGWVQDNIITPITNKASDMLSAGKTLVNNFWDGLKSVWNDVKSWWDGLTFSSKTANVNVKKNGDGYATGLNYVPYDEFPAILHRGEAVLTAAEARVWRANGLNSATPAMAGGITINQYIQSVPQTPADLANATEAYFEQARWML